MRSLPTCTSSFGAVRDVIDAKPAEECSHVNNDPAPCSNAIMEDAAQINTITAMSFPQKVRAQNATRAYVRTDIIHIWADSFIHSSLSQNLI